MREIHPPISSITFGSVILYVCKVALCVLAAWLFYQAFERNTPAIRLWLASRLASRAVAAPREA